MLKQYGISPDIIAFSTQRTGGVSIGNYASFNANHYCGDDPQHVAENRAILCHELGIPEVNLIVPHQTHETNVLEITPAFLQLPAEERQLRMEGIDAVYTLSKGICVCVSTADCIPVLLYQEQTGLVAAIHAGWRGTCARIVEKTLQHLKQAHGIDPAGMKAVIGPGISQDAFEIGDEVYEAFRKEGFDMTRIARRYPAQVGEKWHIDLWECNRLQLLAEGVRPENILLSGICTYGNPDEFFSARRLGIKSGRILNGILRK